MIVAFEPRVIQGKKRRRPRASRLQQKVARLESMSPGASALVEQLVDKILAGHPHWTPARPGA